MRSQTFTSFIGDFGDRSWYVLFVNAPFNETRDAYVRLTGKPVSGILPVTTGDHAFDPTGAVAELVDNEWTTIFHIVGRWDSFDAAALSKLASCRVIAYEAEDTSGSSDCSSITPDGTVTRMQDKSSFEAEADLYDQMNEYAEESGVEPEHPHPEEIISDYDEYFASEGIALIKISVNEDSTEIVVDADDLARVGRVVIIENSE